MTAFKSWRWLLRKRNILFDGGTCGFKMKPFMGIICTVMLFVVYRTTKYQYRQTELVDLLDSELLNSESRPQYPLREVEEEPTGLVRLNGLPRGIINATSDLALKPLWLTGRSKSKENDCSPCYLLAISVGINQMGNVNSIVQKFLPENFTIVLFHYDGKLDGWWDLEWSNKAIHIVAQNQTKWWFAKRFLHPSIVSIYDYIFLWDEDLGVEHFNPRRYLEIVKEEGLEISQPALDPNSTGIHHRITVRSRKKRFHRRVYDTRGSKKCYRDSEGPPCTGFVEGMAPVFSRAAWHCAWHLIQSDLIHGWGMDMKLGYCAQGDRTRNVGVVDSEFVFHRGIHTLGGPSVEKDPKSRVISKRHGIDVRVEARRMATLELAKFKKRWEDAVKEDVNWVEPYKWRRRRRVPQRNRHNLGVGI